MALSFIKDGEKHIFHMTFKGAIVTPINKFLKYNIVHKEFEIIPQVSLEFFIAQRMGEPYGKLSGLIVLANMCFPIIKLLSLLKIKPIYNCANFARQVDPNGLIKSWSHIDFNWATSKQLFAACESSNEFRIQ